MYTRPNFHDDNDIGSDHQPVQNIFGCQIDKPKTIHKEEISIYNKIHISISIHHPLQNVCRLKLTTSQSQQAPEIFYKFSFERNDCIWLLHSHVKLSVPESHTNEV